MMKDIDVMNSMVVDWVMNKPNAYRIHVSHNDMDGYACTAVVKFFGEYVYNDPRYPLRTRTRTRSDGRPYTVRKRNILYGNCEVGMKNVMAMLEEKIQKIIYNSAYVPGKDVISILITDIGQVDVAEIVNHFMESGHHIHYLVVDHHVDTKGYGDLHSAYRSHAAYQQVLTSGWFSFPGKGACELLYNALSGVLSDGYYLKTYNSRAGSVVQAVKMDGRLNGSVTEYKKRAAILGKIIHNVSESDIGNWDTWEKSFQYLGPVSAQRLLWSFYSRIPKGGERWLEDMYDMCVNMKNPGEMTQIWNALIKEEHRKILLEYDFFRDSLSTETNCFENVKTELIDLLLKEIEDRNYKAMYVPLRSDDGRIMFPNFSVISKKHMENHQADYNLLVGYDHIKHEVSLRSYDKNVDCSLLATVFGGGGHARASGFPVADVYIYDIDDDEDTEEEN